MRSLSFPAVTMVLILFLTAFTAESHAQPTIAVPDGYAQGTTGGGSAAPVNVSTAAAFKTAAAGTGPKVIIVNGNLNVGGFSVGSNTTVVGANQSAGLYGGRISANGTNYIFQNLNFGPGATDVMEISGGTKVFITKCSFHDAGDELLSIVREADYVTVSWCKFYFDNTHSHAFAHLIGNSDTRTTDRGKLHVTMHHNWYAEGVVGRMPRVRYGHVHLYNNYYSSSVGGYAIGIGFECHVKVENTWFENIDKPWADYGGTGNGEIGWANLKFVSCTQPTFMPNAYPVFTPPYSYTMDPVDDVKAIVTAGAGNVFGTGSNDQGRMEAPSGKFTIYARTKNALLPLINNYSGENIQVNLYDGLGQFLKEGKFGQAARVVDISGFSSGMYYIEVKAKNLKTIRKIINIPQG